MKKNLIAVVVALGGSFLLGACSPNSNPSDQSGSQALLNQKNAFSYQLVTSTEWLSTAPASLNAIKKAPANDQERVLLEKIDLVASNDPSAITLASKTSDKAEYASLDEITYKGLDGQNATVQMYYNVVRSQTETENDRNSSAVETEQESYLEGILVIAGQENPFQAKREVETEVDESEEKLETRIFTSADKRSYIRSERSVSQEVENAGTESEYSYSYEVFTNGTQTETFSFEKEIEANEAEETEIKSSTGDVFVKMESENGRTIYVVRYKDTNVTDRFEKVIGADGSVSYEKLA